RIALLARQLSHLACVALQDHAHEAGVVRLIDTHDAAQVVLPQHRSAGTRAELARPAQKGTLVNAFVPETPSMVYVMTAFCASGKVTVTLPTGASEWRLTSYGTPSQGGPMARYALAEYVPAAVQVPPGITN